jgi:threonine dehydrogenase-like Zn-dependent dehydrogenase
VITLRNHASLVLLQPTRGTLKIPDIVGYEGCDLLALTSVALHALRRSQNTLGETVVILGAGIIGLTLVQLARMDGARQVIILDLADNRLSLARDYGADLAINPSTDDVVGMIMDTTHGKGASLTVDPRQRERSALAFSLPPGGRIVCAGLWSKTSPSHQPGFLAGGPDRRHQPTARLENIYWPWTQQDNASYSRNDGKRKVASRDADAPHRAEAPQVYDVSRWRPQHAGRFITVGVM